MPERPRALSPEARAALATYRDAAPMPQAARDRVQARLSAVPAPARRARPARRAWLWGVAGAVAASLLLWGSLEVTDALRSTADDGHTGSQAPMQALPNSADTAAIQTHEAADAPPGPPPPPKAPSAGIAPAPLETIGAVEQRATRDPPAAKAPPRARHNTRPAPEAIPQPIPPTLPANRLGAENRLIASTWEQVRSKQYAKAKQTLAEHASEFPSGILAPERGALVVIVECLQHPELAAGKAEAYAAKGRSTLLAKVRSACDPRKSPAK